MSSLPSHGELQDRDCRVSGVTVQTAAGSTTQRSAVAPAAIAGASSPAMRAGAELMRVTSVAEVERAGLDEAGKQHAEGRLQADDAEGRLLVGHVLLLRGVRRVVGGDAVEDAAPERLDERLTVALGAQRRVHLDVRVERRYHCVVE